MEILRAPDGDRGPGRGLSNSATPGSGRRATGATDPYRTLTLVKPSAPPGRIPIHRSGGGRRPRSKSKPALLGYAIAAAVGAVVGVLIAAALSAGGSSARNENPPNPRPTVASLRASAVSRGNPESSASESEPIGLPSSAGISSSAEPDRSYSNPAPSVMRKVERKALVRPPTRRGSGRESLSALKTLPIAVSRDETWVQLPVGTTRYCSSVSETVFVSSQRAADGFEGVAPVLRADAAMMRVAVSLSVERPREGQPFFISLGFENGGDYSVQIQRLEESTGARRFRPIAGALVPVSVAPGGLKELHRYRVSLSGRSFETDFSVVDRNGDTWKAAVRFVPCES